MTESVSLNSVSLQMLSDIKSAFRSYAQYGGTSAASEDSEETKTYTNRGQITRQAYYDIQKAFPRSTESEDDSADAEETILENAVSTTIQSNNTENVQVEIKADTKTYNLPKNTDTIIAELKRNGMHKMMSAYQIAEEYNISYMSAREILDTLNQDSNGFVVEYNLPENSTISYRV